MPARTSQSGRTLADQARGKGRGTAGLHATRSGRRVAALVVSGRFLLTWLRRRAMEGVVACTPFTAPTVGLFYNSTQGVWNNVNETQGTKSCAYSSGVLTVTGPNGSTTFSPPLGGFVRHKFFGTGNYL